MKNGWFMIMFMIFSMTPMAFGENEDIEKQRITITITDESFTTPMNNAIISSNGSVIGELHVSEPKNNQDSFYRDLMLVTLPIGLGALSTYGISQGWQKYQHKSKLKKELIEEFYNSFIASYTKQVLFVQRVIGYYLNENQFNGRDWYTFPTQFPNNPSQQPRVIFSEDYEKLSKELDKIEIECFI